MTRYFLVKYLQGLGGHRLPRGNRISPFFMLMADPQPQGG
jgi:hypothetical protein